MTIKEESKNWSKERLRNELLRFVDHWNSFEAFLIRELGRETYVSLCNEFALEDSAKVLKKLGMTDKDVAEFSEMMGNAEWELKA